MTNRERSTILGLTGSLGSGKSFVSSLLSQSGAKVICADKLAREAVSPGSPALNDIRTRFGDDVLQADGTLDRGRLGNLVFQDPASRRALEEIIHPRVRKRELELLGEYEGHPLIVLDVPLLFEKGLDRHCNHTAAVIISEEERYRRLRQERGLTKEQVDARLRAQMPQEEKAARASTVIDNSGAPSQTANQVNALLVRIFGENLPAPLRFLTPENHVPSG